MTEDDRLTGEIPGSAPLRFACECGYRAEYARAASVDFIYFSDAARQFTVDCPGCDTARPAQVLKGAFTGSVLTCVGAGRFIYDVDADPVGEPVHWDAATVSFEDVPNPVEMAEGVFIIRCSGCDGLLSEDDLQDGTGAPEVGYEYYECPECDHHTHPDTAEVVNT